MPYLTIKQISGLTGLAESEVLAAVVRGELKAAPVALASGRGMRFAANQSFIVQRMRPRA